MNGRPCPTAPTAEAPAMDARIEKNPAARTVANRPRIPSIPVAVEQAGPRAVHCASVTASAPQELPANVAVGGCTGSDVLLTGWTKRARALPCTKAKEHQQPDDREKCQHRHPANPVKDERYRERGKAIAGQVQREIRPTPGPEFLHERGSAEYLIRRDTLRRSRIEPIRIAAGEPVT